MTGEETEARLDQLEMNVIYLTEELGYLRDELREVNNDIRQLLITYNGELK